MLPAAALLPPQSAAMAAYLGAAAVAAQQNRFLLDSHALRIGRSGSPTSFLPLQSPLGGDTPVLDFSTKRKSQEFDDSDRERDNSKMICDDDDDEAPKSDNDPLDLSVSRKRNNSSPTLPPPSARKISRQADYKSASMASPWISPIAPFFPTGAASLSPKNIPMQQHSNEHNGIKGAKHGQANDATKALEKMSELSRLGGNDIGRPSSGSTASASTPSSGRHSAWQSHWLNKGADSVKDVFKCVWCKQSFPTLESLTVHMKETQHLGVNMDGQRHHHAQAQPQHNPHHQNHNAPPSSSSGSTSKADLNLLIKETMPLPRKLVRGQDVWLGKGAEQTRQILKCMWCGESFRSLSEMTAHMQRTQHYTNIISQEQIISWKSSDDTKGGANAPGTQAAAGGNGNNSSSNGSASSNSSISTVSAVLTCKVCDQAFSSLKDLSNHMVKNAHYKEHIMRSISESGGRRRQTREKRKKSLPVRKLLEIERAQNDYKNGDSPTGLTKSLREAGTGRITCEKCGGKIDTNVFVEHIRQCIGADASAQRTMLKTNAEAINATGNREGRKSVGDESSPSPNSRMISPSLANSLPPKEGNSNSSNDKNSSPSVLNAIEQLIEKSFDTRSRHTSSSSNFTANSQQNAPLGSSILKRLGIDESVDYTKPLIDTQTMNLLRGFSQQTAAGTMQFGRERSVSESSSVSDRGSSVIDSIATPDRRTDSVLNDSQRGTPDKKDGDTSDDNSDTPLKIKLDPDAPMISVKKENDGDNVPLDATSESHSNYVSSPGMSPRHSTPNDDGRAPIPSPHSDASPRSTPGSVDKKSKSSAVGSLGALSSMFDSLTGPKPNSNKSNENTRKVSTNPLAALQKLCDKTENNAPQSRQSTSSGNSQSLPLSVPIQATNSAAAAAAANSASNALLAFSWACNDALVAADATSIKCAFCDTPFTSKNAYRQHLSKVHYVRDESLLDPIVAKAQKFNVSRTPPSQSHSPKSVSSTSSHSNGHANSRLSKSPTPPVSMPNPTQSNTPSTSSTGATIFEESPHSKFLKYTELAKQLSSKHVWHS